MALLDTVHLRRANGTTGTRGVAGRRFWPWWALANVAGCVLGLIVFVVEGSFVEAAGLVGKTPEPIFGAILGATFGAGLGIAQWLVLRRWLDQTGWWAPATIVGLALAGVVIGSIGRWEGLAGEVLKAFVVQGPVIGGALGLLQWLILRRQVDHAGWWVPANVVAWALGGAVGNAVDVLFGGPFGLVVMFIACPLLAGVVLARLLRPGAAPAGQRLVPATAAAAA